MNSNFCFVTLFLLLDLENVSSIICSPFSGRRETKVKTKIKDHPIETQDFKCDSQKMCEWHHRYQNDGLQIAKLNKQKCEKTIRLTMKVENFDNNTEIYCEDSKKGTERPVEYLKTLKVKVNSDLNFYSNKDEDYKNLIKIEAGETLEKTEEPTYYTIYSIEKENVSFHCPEPNNTAYIQLGIINTTSKMIKTFNSKFETFNITHNGTILCCIYYNVNETAGEIWISRVVTNKTLLHYKNVREDSLESKETFLNTTSTNIDSAAHQGLQNIIIIVAAAAIFTLLVIVVTCKKCCRKKQQPEAKVLYADLDLLRQTQSDSLPRPAPAEESPYARIIGEMRPETT